MVQRTENTESEGLGYSERENPEGLLGFVYYAFMVLSKIGSLKKKSTFRREQ